MMDNFKKILTKIDNGPNLQLESQKSYSFSISQKIPYDNLSDPSAASIVFKKLKFVGLRERCESVGGKYQAVVRISEKSKYDKITWLISDPDTPNIRKHKVEFYLSTPGTRHEGVTVIVKVLGQEDEQMVSILGKSKKRLVKMPGTVHAAIISGLIGMGSIASVSTASGIGASSSTKSQTIHTSTSTTGGSASSMVSSKIFIVAMLSMMAIPGGLILPDYLDSHSSLNEITDYISLANAAFANNQTTTSHLYFEHAKDIYEETEWFGEDHQNYAEELYMLSLAGMGNSLRLEALAEAEQTGNEIDKIKLEQAEEIYKFAIDLNSDKYDIENLWIARGLNAIYYDTEKTIEYCSMSNSIEGHLCQAEGYVFLAQKGENTMNKEYEHMNIALSMAENSNEIVEVQDRINKIKEYYKIS